MTPKIDFACISLELSEIPFYGPIWFPFFKIVTENLVFLSFEFRVVCETCAH